MSGRFGSVLADRLDAYREVLVAARDLVSALERHADERLAEIQERRARAMARVDRLAALHPDLRAELRAGLLEALRPIADEARRCDAQAERLLQDRQAQLLAQIESARRAQARSQGAGTVLDLTG